DRYWGLGCLGTLVLGVGLFIAAVKASAEFKDRYVIATAIVFGVGTLYTLVQMHLSAGRDVRKRVLPRLAKGLAPLQPTRDEISLCVYRCRSMGMKIGELVDPDMLSKKLQRD